MGELVSRNINFNGGINRLPLLGEGQVKLMQNARPLLTGGCKVRGGQTLDYSVGADATIGSITDLYGYHTSALGLRMYSLRRTNAGDKLFDGTTEITGDVDLVGADYTSIVEGKGTIFVSNGDSADIQYHIPGQTVRQVITNSFSGEELPQCKYLAVYKNRLYAFTNLGLRYTNTGIYSTLSGGLHFPDANVVQVREENATARGLVVGENLLLLLTDDSYTIMTGTPGNNGANNTRSLEEFQGVGCRASRTLTSKGKLIFWLDTENRARLLEGPVLTDLDEEDYIAEYLQRANNTRSTSAKILGRELWLSLPTGSSSQSRRILVYDLFLRRWIASFTNIKGYATTYVPELNAVYVGSDKGGYIWRQANGRYQPNDDAGTLIPFEFQDKSMIFGTLWHQKIYEKILVAMKLQYSESLTFTYTVDELENFQNFELNNVISETTGKWDTAKWGAAPWATSGLLQKVLMPFNDRGLRAGSFALKVTGNLNAGSIYYGAEYHADPVLRDGASGTT
jgi:hypothetical protein